VTLARLTGIALSELEVWHPRDLATLVDQLDEEMAAQRRANRKR
jgi:RNase P/RNase MRP subunit p30